MGDVLMPAAIIVDAGYAHHEHGIYVGSHKDFLNLNRATTLAVLRPVGKNIHWSQAPEALARMAGGSHLGKVGLSVN